MHEQKQKLLTLGFLTYYHKEGCIFMLNGAFENARKNQVNMIGFGCDLSTKTYADDMGILSDMIRKQNLDGLLFLGWLQSTGINFTEFCNKFKGIPLFSIGSGYQDIPNVYMDGSVYYRELLIHLIEKHHCRRIALFSPNTWDERIRVYIEVMQHYRIYDSQLLLRSEDLTIDNINLAQRAKKGLSILLDERKTSFDAIALMYSYEYPVLLEELKKRGFRIPEDVKIIGYEDLEEAKYSIPALTTVYFPFYELGYYGCENFIKSLRGISTPISMCIPGRIILRQSCGCLTNAIDLASFPLTAATDPVTLQNGDDISALIKKQLVRIFPGANFNIDKLINSIFEGIKSKDNTLFLNTFKKELESMNLNDDDSLVFENFISSLRLYSLPYFPESADTAWLEVLFHQARILITSQFVKKFGYEDFQKNKVNIMLQEIGQKLVTTFNKEKLIDLFVSVLLKIRIPSCYIFLFDKNRKELTTCTPTLKYLDFKYIQTDPTVHIPVDQILSAILPRDRFSALLFYLLKFENEIFGFIFFENGPMEIDFYRILTIQLSMAFKSAILLEKVTTTNRELSNTQTELVSKAHQAGMADIAADSIHNIGNVLNSVNTSVHLIQNSLDLSPIKELERAINLLDEHENNLKDFICFDPRGKKLLRFLLLLEPSFTEAYKQIAYNLTRLQEKISLIDEIINAQQTYAGAKSILEEMELVGIIEDTLKMLSYSLERNQIVVIKNFRSVPKVNVQKNKLFHILVNLINNAQEAMINVAQEHRRLSISLRNDEHYVYIDVNDTGHGILPELLPALFTGEFTTKKGRHGFGLRCCSNYMTEMGGHIFANSAGPGTGATFCLRFSWNQR